MGPSSRLKARGHRIDAGPDHQSPGHSVRKPDAMSWRTGVEVTSEREAKLIASSDLRLPDFDGLVAGASATALAEQDLDAVYYDTAQLDLARWGVTLRHRPGEDGPPWTLKLPGSQNGAAL